MKLYLVFIASATLLFLPLGALSQTLQVNAEVLNVRSSPAGKVLKQSKCRLSRNDTLRAVQRTDVDEKPWCKVEVIESDTCDPESIGDGELWVAGWLTKTAPRQATVPVPVSEEACCQTETGPLQPLLATGQAGLRNFQLVSPLSMDENCGSQNICDCRISSNFGNRTHPISGEPRLHTGLDISAPVGSPVRGIFEGMILERTFVPYGKSGYGTRIRILHFNRADANFLSELTALINESITNELRKDEALKAWLESQTPNERNLVRLYRNFHPKTRAELAPLYRTNRRNWNTYRDMINRFNNLEAEVSKVITTFFEGNSPITRSIQPDSVCGTDGMNRTFENLETLYAHLDFYERGTSIGSIVSAGQTIGYVGQSGSATGPHLHFETDTARCPRSGCNPRTLFPTLPPTSPNANFACGEEESV